MWKKLPDFFKPPIFEGANEKTRHAELLHYSTIIIFSFSLVLFWLNWAIGTEAERSLTWILGLLALLQIPIFWMIRAGHVDLVSFLLLTGSWGIMTAFGRNAAGIHDVAIMGYVVIFIGSAILLGWRVTVGYALLSIAAVWWLASLQTRGDLTPEFGTPYRIALDLTVVLVLMFVVVFFFIRALTRAIKNAQYEMSERQRVEAERERLIVQLSEEVAERKQAQDELQKLAMTDFLTGLFNRRHFFEVAKKEFAEAIRYNRPLSIIIFDLDLFKDVNDTYGHHIGDQALIQIGNLLRKTIREPDIPARYGGEEFIVLLPETDCSQAQIAAERLRKLVQDTPIQTGDTLVHITISVGVAGKSNNKKEESVDHLISKADQAMYKAKNAGRNQVVCHHEENEMSSS